MRPSRSTCLMGVQKGAMRSDTWIAVPLFLSPVFGKLYHGFASEEWQYGGGSEEGLGSPCPKRTSVFW